ncbi:UNVERIFIED_CONTAM: hypothetical protein Sindi_2887300 [Sesamum indicum]
MASKCTSHQRNHMVMTKKLKDLRKQFAEKESHEKTLVAENESLNGELSDLTAVLEKAKDKAFSDGRREGMFVGREEGLKEGHKAGRLDGIEERKFDRIHVEEHERLLTKARLQAARDFLKSTAFQMAVEMKAAHFFNDGLNTCKAQTPLVPLLKISTKDA